MLKREFFQTREDGVKLYRAFSDSGLLIKKIGAGEIYSEAIDIEADGFSYLETDIPVPENDELTVEDTLMMLSELGVDINDDEE